MPETRRAYRAAGVDVDAGSRAVDLIRGHVESTRRVEVLGGLGGFGGAFTVPAGYREPVLVASTDGVGTKTAIAAAVGRFDTIGIDLVAMCVDDIVCTGAEPLAFLDYVAVGELDPIAVAELVSGVAAGCRETGCALVGGETAEHPGLMAAGAFDLAGTAIGVVERSRMHRRVGRPGRRRHRRPGIVRAPLERLLAGPHAPEPVGARPRRAVPGRACAGRSATRPRTTRWRGRRRRRWRRSARRS